MVMVFMLSVFTVAGCGGNKQEGATTSKPAEKQDEKQIVFKLADSLPASHIFSVQGGQFFIKRVEELTNKKVKFQHYPAEQLGKAKDLLDLVRTGTADIAYVGPAYAAGKLPLCGVGELPGLFNDSVAASKAYWKICQSVLYEKELKKQGVVPLVANLLPPYQALNTRKPVKSLADMKGLKMRVGGGTIEETAALAGAVPVTMTPPEIFEGLQRGTIDGTLISFTSSKAYKLEELIKHSTVGANFGSFAFLYCINEKVWQGLSEDIKKAMKQAGEETVVNVAKAIAAEEVKVSQDWEKRGIQLYNLKAQEQKEWNEKLQPVNERWIGEMEKKGLPAREVFNEFKKALQEVK